MTSRNETPEDSEAELRRAFELALSDSMKGDKVNASMLDVIRKYLADRDAERRWQSERADLDPPQKTPQGQPTGPLPLPFPGADRLPFPVPECATDDSRPARDVGPMGTAGDFGFAGS